MLTWMLLTCLQFLVQYSCPRCYTLKDKIPELGMLRDTQRWLAFWVDTEAIRLTPKCAYEIIFEQGFGVSSVAVKRILSPKSMVSHQVYLNASFSFLNLLWSRAHFLFVWWNMASISMRCLLLTWCMSLSLVSGSPLLFIFYKFSTSLLMTSLLSWIKGKVHSPHCFSLCSQLL